MIEQYVIAGPCAAETEQQMLCTAEGIAQCRQLHPNYLYIFRAGVWKPRTSPDTFQGIGAEGLKWLQRVRQLYDLPVTTEVATVEQTRLALQAEVDYLWIGARTSANPIAVQTIADTIVEYAMHTSLKGVLIKNPVNEDAELWIGNIERLNKIGVPIIAVHRGCGHRPCWQMPYMLQHRYPHLPLLIDPSHLGGQASAVGEICLKALQLGYQGWMIETHITPQQAWSDAQQQITPIELQSILSDLNKQSNTEPVPNELAWLRAMMDEVDDDLWQILAQRMKISREIGAWKKEQQMAIVQPNRLKEMLKKRIEWGKDNGLDSSAVEQIMDAIHKESVRVQS